MNDVKLIFKIARELKTMCDKLEPRNPLEPEIRAMYQTVTNYINDNYYRQWVNEADLLRKVDEHQTTLPLYRHEE